MCKAMQFVNKFVVFCLKGNLSMNTVENWKPDADDEAQNINMKSVDNVPEVQDPLGSSVMNTGEKWKPDADHEAQDIIMKSVDSVP